MTDRRKNTRTTAVRCGLCAHLIKPVKDNTADCERRGHRVTIIYDVMCERYLNASKKPTASPR